ncbi:Lrp/AsnC family transcriptional regulator [Clostridium sp. YIM B02506]|uniref:siroheme decarboxylase subunit alpha n=1 Tax=Clostridium sp. YIM B02506 TaxID=2910680 RepID=UPI001EEDC145|nr:Lrp/AsnC family transcriptional regulator [Clostridium sp. YIM B02506]
MDKICVDLLNLIQNEFPLESRPYLKISEKLGVSENQVIELLKDLKKDGYIRRLGGIVNSKKVGYYSTLCAAKVPKEKIKEVSKIINSYEGVTHNYIREHSFNMWFTLTASSRESVKRILEEIKSNTGIEEIMELPSINLFKINVSFNLKEKSYV